MVFDNKGFRFSIAIILVNDQNKVFWAKRLGQDAWQFPQGGLLQDETPQAAMFRELYEEIGLKETDVRLLATSKQWLSYKLPTNMIRYNDHPLCLGQRQKWFLLRLLSDEALIKRF